MANEAVVRCQLSINKPYLQYSSLPQQFQATVTGNKGPTPGALTATVAGIDVDLSELDQPGLAIIRNIDENGGEAVWGVKDGSEFYPVGDLLPGEAFPIRFSRYLLASLGTGTGTYEFGSKTLHIRGIGDVCKVSVEAFEA